MSTPHPSHALARLTASTESITFALGVNVVGGGTVTRHPDAIDYDENTPVTLTAVPDQGHDFAGWSGDLAGAENPVTITMTADKTVTATFTLQSFLIDATVGGHGAIEPAGSVAVSYDATASFTITPDPNYHVVDVLVDGVSVGAVTHYDFPDVAAGHTITASFAVDTHTLTVNVIGNGTVSRDPDDPTYDHGSAVSLMPNAGAGSHFVSWGGDASGNDDPLVVTMDANKTITATFAAETFTLTPSAGPHGVITPANPVTVEYGSGATFDIVPDAHYHVADVLVDGVSVGPQTSHAFTNVTANHTLSASFAIDTHTLAVTVVGSGTVTRDPDLAAYDHGALVTLTAVPGAGYRFSGWSGDAGGADNPLAVVMNADRSITATFVLDSYTITPIAGAHGAIAPANPVTVASGGGASFTIVPDAHYHVANVLVDGVSVGAVTSYAFSNVTANHTIEASFAIDTHTLTTTVVGGGGTIQRNPDQATYDYGTVVTLTAQPAAGFTLSSWGGDLSGNVNPSPITINGNRSVTATFTNAAGPTVHVISPNGGQTLTVGNTVHLQWSATDNDGVTSINLYLLRSGAGGASRSWRSVPRTPATSPGRSPGRSRATRSSRWWPATRSATWART